MNSVSADVPAHLFYILIGLVALCWLFGLTWEGVGYFLGLSKKRKQERLDRCSRDLYMAASRRGLRQPDRFWDGMLLDEIRSGSTLEEAHSTIKAEIVSWDPSP